jgi:hypothetical protein
MSVVKYSLLLSDGATALIIPINPEEWSIGRERDYDEMEIIGIGRVPFPKKPGLRNVSWGGYFPRSQQNEPFLVATASGASFKLPQWYVNQINTWMETDKQLTFTAQRYYDGGVHTFDTSFPVFVSQFDYGEQGGGDGDIQYSINLVEYPITTPLKVTIVTAESAMLKKLKKKHPKKVATKASELKKGYWCVLTGYVYKTKKASKKKKKYSALPVFIHKTFKVRGKVKCGFLVKTENRKKFVPPGGYTKRTYLKYK